MKTPDLIPVDAVSGDVQSNKGPHQPKDRLIQPAVQRLLNTYHSSGIY